MQLIHTTSPSQTDRLIDDQFNNRTLGPVFRLTLVDGTELVATDIRRDAVYGIANELDVIRRYSQDETVERVRLIYASDNQLPNLLPSERKRGDQLLTFDLEKEPEGHAFSPFGVWTSLETLAQTLPPNSMRAFSSRSEAVQCAHWVALFHRHDNVYLVLTDQSGHVIRGEDSVFKILDGVKDPEKTRIYAVGYDDAAHHVTHTLLSPQTKRVLEASPAKNQ